MGAAADSGQTSTELALQPVITRRRKSPIPLVVPIRDYAGESELDALTRLGLAGEATVDEIIFLHLG